MQKNKISIIIPFKDTNVLWLTKLIKSLKDQTNKNFEAIFIDDDSSDKFDYKDLILKNNFIYLKKPKDIKGVGPIRDFGVLKSNYEYIFFIDSDDWIENDCVEYLLNCFEKNKDIEAIVFDYHWVFNLRKKYKNKNKFHEVICLNSINKKYTHWFHRNYQTDWRVCFKKAFLVQNNIKHSNSILIFEDVYFGMIWKTLFNKVLLTTKKLYFYNRLNTESILNNYQFKPEHILKVLLSAKNELILTKKFNNVFYFYVLNWIHALFLLKRKNEFDFNIKTIINELIPIKNIVKIKNFGLSKIWFLNIMLKIKKSRI